MNPITSALWVGSALAAARMPASALAALQARRLRRVLEHCARHVPFYAEAWRAAGVEVSDVAGPGDLSRLPIPRRADLERDPESLVARPMLGLYRSGAATIRHSGGSSGGPRLEVHSDPATERRLDAFYLRALLAAGYDPSVPMAYFWGAALPRGPLSRLGLMSKIAVPAHLDEASQARLLEQNPGLFWYYHPTSLIPLAKRFAPQLRAAAPRGIISHAELLPHSARAAIERAVGVPVVDQYGASEFNRMAWECERRDGLHVDADSVLLEVLDGHDRPVRPGEVGRAVVTGLLNFMMPLIRYDLGDLIVQSDRRCACGRTLPMIERVEGRLADVAVLPGGARRTPRELLEPFGDLPALEQYRVVFTAPSEARFELVTTDAAAGALTLEVERRFLALCPGVTLTTRRVPTLEKVETGKRPMVRHLAPASNATAGAA